MGILRYHENRAPSIVVISSALSPLQSASYKFTMINFSMQMVQAVIHVKVDIHLDSTRETTNGAIYKRTSVNPDISISLSYRCVERNLPLFMSPGMQTFISALTYFYDNCEEEERECFKLNTSQSSH